MQEASHVFGLKHVSKVRDLLSLHPELFLQAGVQFAHTAPQVSGLRHTSIVVLLESSHCISIVHAIGHGLFWHSAVQVPGLTQVSKVRSFVSEQAASLLQAGVHCW